jgi:hypothetical protein
VIIGDIRDLFVGIFRHISVAIVGVVVWVAVLSYFVAIVEVK